MAWWDDGPYEDWYDAVGYYSDCDDIFGGRYRRCDVCDGEIRSVSTRNTGDEFLDDPHICRECKEEYVCTDGGV